MKMTLKVNKKYVFVIDLGNRKLTYTGTVISIDNYFVEFVDKYSKTLSYNLKTIISYEEVQWHHILKLIKLREGVSCPFLQFIATPNWSSLLVILKAEILKPIAEENMKRGTLVSNDTKLIYKCI